MPPHTVFSEPCTSLHPTLNSSIKLFFPATECAHNFYSLWSETLNRTCSVGWGCNLLGWEVRDSPQNLVNTGNITYHDSIKQGKGFSQSHKSEGRPMKFVITLERLFLPPNLFTFKKSIYLLIFSIMLPIALVFKNIQEYI